MDLSGTRCKLPAFHRGGPGSISGQCMWNLWWKEVALRFISKYFNFPQWVSFLRRSMLIHSSITDAIRSRQLTASLNNTFEYIPKAAATKQGLGFFLSLSFPTTDPIQTVFCCHAEARHSPQYIRGLPQLTRWTFKYTWHLFLRPGRYGYATCIYTFKEKLQVKPRIPPILMLSYSTDRIIFV